MDKSLFVDLGKLSQADAVDFLSTYTGYNQAIAAVAYEKGHGVEIYAPTQILRIKDFQTNQKKYVYAMHTPLNTESSGVLADNKFNTHIILRDAGLPVTRSTRLIKSVFDSAEKFDCLLSFPLVLKPNAHTVGGAGVVLNITNKEQLNHAIKKLFLQYQAIAIEEYCSYPNEYRVLVLDEKVIAVTQRVPAYIIGDGVTSIQKLIEQKNKKRLSNPQINMKAIPLDDVALSHVVSAGYTVQSVLPKNKKLVLQDVVNSSRGGEFNDATDEISEENKDLCIQAARALGLRFVGFDILCNSISEQITEGTGIIVEANEHPGITCHIFPHKGTPRLVQYPIVEALFI